MLTLVFIFMLTFSHCDQSVELGSVTTINIPKGTKAYDDVFTVNNVDATTGDIMVYIIKHDTYGKFTIKFGEVGPTSSSVTNVKGNSFTLNLENTNADNESNIDVYVKDMTFDISNKDKITALTSAAASTVSYFVIDGALNTAAKLQILAQSNVAGIFSVNGTGDRSPLTLTNNFIEIDFSTNFFNILYFTRIAAGDLTLSALPKSSFLATNDLTKFTAFTLQPQEDIIYIDVSNISADVGLLVKNSQVTDVYYLQADKAATQISDFSSETKFINNSNVFFADATKTFIRLSVKVNALAASGFSFVVKSVQEVQSNNFLSIAVGTSSAFDKMIYVKDLTREAGVGKIYFVKSADVTLQVNGSAITEGLLINDNQFVLSVSATTDSQTAAFVVRTKASTSDVSATNKIIELKDTASKYFTIDSTVAEAITSLQVLAVNNIATLFTVSKTDGTMTPVTIDPTSHFASITFDSVDKIPLIFGITVSEQASFTLNVLAKPYKLTSKDSTAITAFTLNPADDVLNFEITFSTITYMNLNLPAAKAINGKFVPTTKTDEVYPIVDSPLSGNQFVVDPANQRLDVSITVSNLAAQGYTIAPSNYNVVIEASNLDNKAVSEQAVAIKHTEKLLFTISNYQQIAYGQKKLYLYVPSFDSSIQDSLEFYFFKSVNDINDSTKAVFNKALVSTNLVAFDLNDHVFDYSADSLYIVVVNESNKSTVFDFELFISAQTYQIMNFTNENVFLQPGQSAYFLINEDHSADATALLYSDLANFDVKYTTSPSDKVASLFGYLSDDKTLTDLTDLSTFPLAVKKNFGFKITNKSANGLSYDFVASFNSKQKADLTYGDTKVILIDASSVTDKTSIALPINLTGADKYTIEFSLLKALEAGSTISVNETSFDSTKSYTLTDATTSFTLNATFASGSKYHFIILIKVHSNITYTVLTEGDNTPQSSDAYYFTIPINTAEDAKNVFMSTLSSSSKIANYKALVYSNDSKVIVFNTAKDINASLNNLHLTYFNSNFATSTTGYSLLLTIFPLNKADAFTITYNKTVFSSFSDDLSATNGAYFYLKDDGAKKQVSVEFFFDAAVTSLTLKSRLANSSFSQKYTDVNKSKSFINISDARTFSAKGLILFNLSLEKAGTVYSTARLFTNDGTIPTDEVDTTAKSFTYTDDSTKPDTFTLTIDNLYANNNNISFWAYSSTEASVQLNSVVFDFENADKKSLFIAVENSVLKISTPAKYSFFIFARDLTSGRHYLYGKPSSVLAYNYLTNNMIQSFGIANTTLVLNFRVTGNANINLNLDKGLTFTEASLHVADYQGAELVAKTEIANNYSEALRVTKPAIATFTFTSTNTESFNFKLITLSDTNTSAAFNAQKSISYSLTTTEAAPLNLTFVSNHLTNYELVITSKDDCTVSFDGKDAKPITKDQTPQNIHLDNVANSFNFQVKSSTVNPTVITFTINYVIEIQKLTPDTKIESTNTDLYLYMDTFTQNSTYFIELNQKLAENGVEVYGSNTTEGVPTLYDFKGDSQLVKQYDQAATFKTSEFKRILIKVSLSAIATFTSTASIINTTYDQTVQPFTLSNAQSKIIQFTDAKLLLDDLTVLNTAAVADDIQIYLSYNTLSFDLTKNVMILLPKNSASLIKYSLPVEATNPTELFVFIKAATSTTPIQVNLQLFFNKNNNSVKSATFSKDTRYQYQVQQNTSYTYIYSITGNTNEYTFYNFGNASLTFKLLTEITNYATIDMTDAKDLAHGSNITLGENFLALQVTPGNNDANGYFTFVLTSDIVPPITADAVNDMPTETKYYSIQVAPPAQTRLLAEDLMATTVSATFNTKDNNDKATVITIIPLLQALNIKLNDGEVTEFTALKPFHLYVPVGAAKNAVVISATSDASNSYPFTVIVDSNSQAKANYDIVANESQSTKQFLVVKVPKGDQTFNKLILNQENSTIGNFSYSLMEDKLSAYGDNLFLSSSQIFESHSVKDSSNLIIPYSNNATVDLIIVIQRDSTSNAHITISSDKGYTPVTVPSAANKVNVNGYQFFRFTKATNTNLVFRYYQEDATVSCSYKIIDSNINKNVIPLTNSNVFYTLTSVNTVLYLYCSKSSASNDGVSVIFTSSVLPSSYTEANVKLTDNTVSTTPSNSATNSQTNFSIKVNEDFLKNIPATDKQVSYYVYSNSSTETATVQTVVDFINDSAKAPFDLSTQYTVPANNGTYQVRVFALDNKSGQVASYQVTNFDSTIKSSGTSWVFILIIVLGGILVLVGVAFLIKHFLCRKEEENADTALLEA